METQKNSNGLRTFLEHWQFAVLAIVVLLTSALMNVFMDLTGTSWICLVATTFALMIFGAVLIGYAKFPVYRSGQFFTFGLKSVPEDLKGFYYWGWRVYLFGALLSLLLLLSKS